MRLSKDELQNQKLKPETYAMAVQQVRTNGHITFENVLPPELITALREAYTPLHKQFVKNPGQTFGKNHFRVYLPFQQPFSDLRLICSPFVIPVVEGLLGSDLVCHYLAANTCAPGSEYQPVHSDYRTLFPGTDIALPAFHIVLNVPLVDVTQENGPVEYWPGGTHYHNVPFGDIDPIAKHMHSEFATMPAGSLMIRDGRMWHRGTENHSKAIRPQIALVYTRPWVDMGNVRIEIPRKVYDDLPEKARHIFREENIKSSTNGVSHN
jgi:hypothetical protein